jgi:hypothetical protein
MKFKPMGQARVRLTARYHGRSNYLLGNREEFNALVFQFEKRASGWKVIDLKGLRPLGFDERFFRLLGSDIGLPLSPAERAEKKGDLYALPKSDGRALRTLPEPLTFFLLDPLIHPFLLSPIQGNVSIKR